MSISFNAPAVTSDAVRGAQAASIFLSAAAAGGSLGLSTFLVPRLLESPTALMLRQWGRTFQAGKIVFPGAAATAAAAFGFVYYRTANAATPSSIEVSASALPLVAAGLCLSIVPYTLLILRPTNKELIAKAAQAEEDAQLSKADRAAGAGTVYTAQEEASAKQLVDRWGTLSLGRSLLLAAAAIVGLVAYL
ncbi:uncharacterized protein SPSK_00059 [Sporothrix schenckii 1099-18]|uniref:DUF1772 domain-containing protein n=2 Tax=Sporothrix schenckii TaxID=29908 RepID=U7PMJ1_SPOS1|nr:uncharacterized protein SPSK_00059 [Sporothrix schenckii 1099-18]ERS96858.1 hypothetical protein HMPREF1624_07067 [Sporothrix schenckii ATCC 58251]KJR79845.1 hypothetical protein SPSK_00059 [Sporothrix schenckii 1099-18]